MMDKIVRLLIALIFTVFMSTSLIASEGGVVASSKLEPSPSSLISMDFQDANLKTVLKIFSQQAGLNFVASQDVQDRTITVYFDNVTVEDALNHIINANNLMYDQEPGSNIFIVKESDEPTIETMTRVYELKYAQLRSLPSGEGKEAKDPEILSVVQGILTERGKMIADKRSNSLIITDVPTQFKVVEEVLSQLDIRSAQILIEAEIVETSVAINDYLGVNWSGYFGTYTGPIANTIAPVRGRFGADSELGEGIGTTGTVDFSTMTATLRAIYQDTDTKILARPKILTLNNETASIELTSQTAVASITTTASEAGGSTTSVQAERIDTGITLNVTPQVNKDGYITMYIEPTVIVPALSTYFYSGTSTFVDPQRRSAKTTVMVKDGETVMIGGLISKEDQYTFKKIPFLGDIPILGLAFRYKSTVEADKELIIFITPRVVREATYALESISDREQEKPKAVREKRISSVLDLIGG